MRSAKYPNSLLYKISGGKSKKPSWILGTMHMICASDFILKDKVLHALEKCSHYYMEVDLGSDTEMDVMQQKMVSLSSVAYTLPPREKDKLNNILVSQFGMTLDEAENIPPIALINKMTTNAIGCEDFKVAEVELLSIAQAAGKVTGGLETGMEQMKIADKVFDGREMLRQLRSAEDYGDLFGKMKVAYATENLFALAAFVNDKRFMSRRAFNILVTSRNKRWAKMIPKLIKDKSVFIAVGAGHLPGETGVLNLLAQQRFNINPVYR